MEIQVTQEAQITEDTILESGDRVLVLDEKTGVGEMEIGTYYSFSNNMHRGLNMGQIGQEIGQAVLQGLHLYLKSYKGDKDDLRQGVIRGIIEHLQGAL